ncbi:MAG: hypothetical protein AAF725_04730, partial [Acidobacteriota bacterium]
MPGPSSRPRLWIANLDAEETWARGRAGGATLPKLARERMAALGSLLRFAAAPGDALWLPDWLDPGRLPALGSGPVDILSGPPRGLCRLRRSFVFEPWARAAPWSSDEDSRIAAAVNDRRFALEVRRDLEREDRSRRPFASRQVASLSDLRAAIEALEAPAEAEWVLKAPLSAAGRHRFRGRGSGLERADAARIERLLARSGALIFEPWHRRDLDAGVLFEVGPRGALGEPRAHLQEVDPRGAVTALTVGPRAEARLGEGLDLLLETALRVAQRLAARGYRGPAGIDAWRFFGAAQRGNRRWHPLGE